MLSCIEMVPGKDGQTMYPYLPLAHLPFHLCSIQIAFIFYTRFSHNERLRTALLAFMYPSCLTGALLALLMPSIVPGSVAVEDMFRLTEGFGSGIGGLKDTCGAVMGMFLIISLANSAGDMEDPTRTKLDTYAKFQEAAELFKEKRGSLYCRDLKTEDGPQPLPCCMACVEDAAQILEELLKKWEIVS